MSLLPQTSDGVMVDFESKEQASQTYKIVGNRITGYTDEIDALKQAIYKILNTIRYEFFIYSWNYGAELTYLIGEEVNYCLPEIKTNISEALSQDDRIISVDEFEFTVNKNSVTCDFVVNSVYGKFDESATISI